MIEYLHLIQDAEGYLPTTLLMALSEELSLSVVEGTFKDRHYLERYPHRILEGMLIEEYCGGMAPGHGFKAYLPGGASGGILPARLGDIPLNFDTLNEYGCFIGSAAVNVLSDQDSVREVARIYAASGGSMIFWGMGVSQHVHGTDNARCLINLALMTGQIGRPGTGLHPLRGQNNVQGASDAGLIPMMFPDY